jgi:P-type Cu2+ transporter
VTAVRAANDHIHHPHDIHNHAAHAPHGGYAGHDHSQMVADFRKRFGASFS